MTSPSQGRPARVEPVPRRWATAPRETAAGFGGETWTKRYSKAQAVEIVGQLKPVTAPFEGAARGSSASARGSSPLVNKAGNHAASKRGVLEPWPAEIGRPRAVVRVRDPSSHGEALAY